MTDIAICKTNSCYTCSTADHAACVARAAGGICKSLIDDNQVTCLDPIEANRATWETACGANAPNFAQAFATVSATMCGE